MELREPEAICVEDDHHGRLGHVHPDLDDRGRHEYWGRAAGECLHGRLLLGAGHPSGERAYPRSGERRLIRKALHPLGHSGQWAPRVLRFQRLQEIIRGFGPISIRVRPPRLIIGVDTRADDVDPAPGGDLARRSPPDPLHPRLPLPGHQVGGDGTPTRWKFIEDRRVEVAEYCHGDRARDGGGGHDQQVRGALGSGDGVDHAAALAQGIALSDPEAVLLIDNHQSQGGNLDRLGQQGVRPHDDGGLTGRHQGEDLATLRSRCGSGQQHDPGGALRATEHSGPPQGPQKPLKTGVMLGRQNLGGSQEGGLPTGTDDLGHGAQSNEGLAAAHVALQENLHGNSRVQGGSEVLADARLSGGELIGQSGVQVGAQGVGPGNGPGHGGACCPMPSAPLDESRLEDEGLLIAQLAARGPPLLGILRRVNPAIGGVGVDEIVRLAHMRGQRIGDVRRIELIEDSAHRLGDAPTRQGLGGRVDGNRSGPEGLALRLIELVEDLEAGPCQLLSSPMGADLARQQHGGAR